MELAHVGIPHGLAVHLGHQIGVTRAYARDALAKLGQAGRLELEGDRRLAHVRRVDGKQRLRVIWRRTANRDVHAPLPQTIACARHVWRTRCARHV